MKKSFSIFTLLFCICFSSGFTAEPVSLFDGKTLSGWSTEDPNLWRVEDGMITGGSLTEMVQENTFLLTDQSFQNFELTLEVRLLGTEGFVNSGFQIRSVPVDGNGEMSGYQVDAGDGWWGKLYDESRRNMVIAESADMDAIDKAVKRGEWNKYRILAEGKRIRSWINDVPALDYTEADDSIAQDGHFAIQVHSDGKAKVQVKNIYIRELPATAGITTWEQVGMPVHN